MNKRIGKVFTWLFFIALFVTPIGVDAAVLSINSSHDMCYGANGIYTGQGPHGTCGGYYTTFKQLDGQMAFCAQLGKNIQSGTNYTVYAGWDVYNKASLIAGKCIELVFAQNNKWGINDPYAQYLYSTELVNYIFKYNGSYDFVSGNSVLSSIYNEAKTFVEQTAKYSGSASSRLPRITLSGAKDMKSTSTAGEYLSDKITLNGMVASYGGSGTKYEVSAVASGATAQICVGENGTTCNTKVEYSNTSDSKSFYVKVTGGTAGGDVRINVVGSNTSSYPTVVRYDEASGSYQVLMVPGYVNFTRKISTSLTLNIPDKVNRYVKVEKVDEDGNALDGAELELYQADKNSKNKVKVLSAQKSGVGTLKWTSTASEDTDNFFNYTYCVAENKSPKGYVIGDPKCLPNDVLTPNEETVEVCVGPDNQVSSDNKYCGARYSCDSYGEGYEMSGTQCVKTTYPLPTCSEEGYEYDSTSKQCIKRVDAIVNTDTGESSCSNGSEPVDGKCTVVSTSGAKCSGDKLPNEDGKCVETDSKHAVCSAGDNKYCDATGYSVVQKNGKNFTIIMDNKRTSVTISKRSITGGDAEVPGAKLKICSDKPDKNGKCTDKNGKSTVVKLEQPGLKCPTYTSELNEEETGVSNCKNSDNGRIVDVSWTSGDVPREWKGLETGKTYYLVEETPPRGYVPVTIATEFKINTDGTVKAGEKSVENGLVVINNNLTSIQISKDDIATSKELPGAEIVICDTHKDEKGNIVKSVDDNGNCTVATLADGTSASWTSGDKAHEVVGLPIGTYILEERIAPKGYSTAESIIFMLKSDGTLADKDGKSLADNKLVMHDKRIGDVKTGMLGVYIVLIIVTLGIVGGAGSYYFLKKKGNLLS